MDHKAPADDKMLLSGCILWAENGMALLVKEVGQGHAYAMHVLGSVLSTRMEYELAMEWYTEAGAYTRSR